ncbi:hypothetical protein N7528_002522 [Penicillium herquei]|nr:hypothetical protein N7528_002522 [Penicillium herquei]
MGRAQRPPCFQCRSRKVRCDRRLDQCANCERLSFKCSFQKVSDRDSVVRADPKVLTDHPGRRRGIQACIECHRQKARCSGDFPACANCQRRQRPCRYPGSSSRLSHKAQHQRSPDQGNVGQDGNEEISGEAIQRKELEERVDEYFKYLYPIPLYAFLHEPSIRQQFIEGTLNPHLAWSIAAVVKEVLSPNQGHSDESQLWIAQVETHIWKQLERPDIICLQCLLLVIHYFIQVGRFSRAYMLAGLAARGATALRLNHERPELGFIAQETRRRVLWALSSIDGSFSVGLPEYETIPHAVIYQRLPCSEEAFRDGRLTLTSGTNWLWRGNNDSAEGCSLFSACIRVAKISKDIMRLTRQLALSEQPLTQLSGLVQEIQNDLWRLQTDVELAFQYQVSSPAQVAHMRSSRWFVRYLQISITWNQVHCDLYRLFLPDYIAAAPKIITDSIDHSLKTQALEKCREHVLNINCIIRGILDLSPSPVLLPPFVAVCAYHATRLTLFLPCATDLNRQNDWSSATDTADVALSVLRRFFAKSAAAEKVILDMENLVNLSKMGPEPVYQELRYPLPPFDQGLHRHSHLAVHSLIRQSNFIDGGYEIYDG